MIIYFSISLLRNCIKWVGGLFNNIFNDRIGKSNNLKIYLNLE